MTTRKGPWGSTPGQAKMLQKQMMAAQKASMKSPTPKVQPVIDVHVRVHKVGTVVCPECQKLVDKGNPVFVVSSHVSGARFSTYYHLRCIMDFLAKFADLDPSIDEEIEKEYNKIMDNLESEGNLFG